MRYRGRQARAQVVHPVTGRRLSLSAPSQGDLVELTAAVRRVGVELRAGHVSVAEAERRIARIVRGVPRSPRRVAEIWAAWLATLGPETLSKARSTWRCHLRAWFGDRPAELVTDAALEAWGEMMRARGYAPKTIRSAYWLLAAAFRRAVKLGELERVPWSGYAPPRGAPRRVHAIARSACELERLFAAADADDAREREGGRQHADLGRRVRFVAWTGVRNGELAALGWDDVDLDAATVHVRRQALDGWRVREPSSARPTSAPKGKRARLMRVSDGTVAILREQREHLRALGFLRADGPVWPSPDGRYRPNANGIYPEDLKRLVIAAGLPSPELWCVHSLRHTHAHLELERGAAPRALQRRLGHASLRTTDIYTRELDAAPTALDDAAPRPRPPAERDRGALVRQLAELAERDPVAARELAEMVRRFTEGEP